MRTKSCKHPNTEPNILVASQEMFASSPVPSSPVPVTMATFPDLACLF